MADLVCGTSTGSAIITAVNKNTNDISGLPAAEQTLTNKTLDDFTNNIHANVVHHKIKCVEVGGIAKGKAVKQTGWNDGENAVEVVLADSSTEVSIGIANSTLANGEYGGIVTTGAVEDIDTTGGGESWAINDLLFVNGSGDLTNIEPTTGYAQPIARVLRAHAINGDIQVLAAYPKQDADDVRYDATKSVKDELDLKSPTTHNHSGIYEPVLGFTPEDSANKGNVNGYAELDASGLVPAAQLPAYVDDVVEYADFASLPGTGETGKIYVTLDDNKTYRWSGSAYTEISASLALGETSSTAYRGDRGKTAYDHSQAAHAPTNADNTSSNETSHSDVVVDGDFTSNGVLNRTGAGTYSILAIGTEIQAYDADTAKTDVAQTFTASQRGAITTDNDGSLSLASTNHFKVTPSAATQLTFTDLATQSGNIILDNSGGETITKGSMVKAGSDFLTDVTSAGVYWLSYHSDGTNVYISYSEALS